jgi:hypothetical protein
MEEEQVVSTEEVAKEVVETPAEEVAETPVPEKEPEVEAKEEPTFTLPPPRKKTAQERIDEITRLRREAERETEYWKNLALKKEQAPVKVEKPAEQAPFLPQRPVKFQYETEEAYEDALLEWNNQRAAIQAKTEHERIQKEQAQRKAEEDWKRFDRKGDALRAVYEDYDEIIKSPVFTPAMQMVILESDNGPELAYFLGRPENRDTADRLLNLSVERQIYELGKLETSLLIAKKTKKVPSAPAPINPVATGGMSGEIDISKMTIDEFMEYERKKIRDRYEAEQKGKFVK